jgi:hypothetical protein
LKAAFGAAGEPVETSSVPEPAGLTLAVLAMLMGLSFRNKR